MTNNKFNRDKAFDVLQKLEHLLRVAGGDTFKLLERFVDSSRLFSCVKVNTFYDMKLYTCVNSKSSIYIDLNELILIVV